MGRTWYKGVLGEYLLCRLCSEWEFDVLRDGDGDLVLVVEVANARMLLFAGSFTLENMNMTHTIKHCISEFNISRKPNRFW